MHQYRLLLVKLKPVQAYLLSTIVTADRQFYLKCKNSIIMIEITTSYEVNFEEYNISALNSIIIRIK